MKRDREDMFKKRAMGDKSMAKGEREVIRKKNQVMRDEWDMSHLGDYKLVYPVKDNPVSFTKIIDIG